MPPLRSYLLWLLPPARERASHPILHYVVEESTQRAAEVSTQSYPGYRIIGMRDVTDEAAAAQQDSVCTATGDGTWSGRRRLKSNGSGSTNDSEWRSQHTPGA